MASASTKKTETTLRLSLTVSSLNGVQHRFSVVVAGAYSSVLGELRSRALAKRLDVLVSELVGNVLEHSKGRKKSLQVELLASAKEIEVRVTNAVAASVCERIKRHVAGIRRSDDPKTLMAETMQARRAKGQMGGVGLIRLVAETKAILSVSYDRGKALMRVTARVPIGDQK